MKRCVLCFLFLLSLSPEVWALAELSGNFSYQKQVFGEFRQNSTRYRMYAGSFALYLFDVTALELNFSETHQITTQHDTVGVEDTSYSLIGAQNKVINQVAGIGIRQSLVPRGASIRPLISVGYARQFITDKTNYLFRNDSTGVTEELPGTLSKRRVDSVFGTFALNIHLTKFFALQGSVNTVFKAFEFEKARDNMKYLAGFTWVL